jgi:hypothetical protein
LDESGLCTKHVRKFQHHYCDSVPLRFFDVGIDPVRDLRQTVSCKYRVYLKNTQKYSTRNNAIAAERAPHGRCLEILLDKSPFISYYLPI